MGAMSADTLAELTAQEDRLKFRRFDNETALELGLHLLNAVRERSLPVTVSVRRGGQRLFHAAREGHPQVLPKSVRAAFRDSRYVRVALTYHGTTNPTHSPTAARPLPAPA
jgi:uncharacterized protein (UPF0303 family)